MEILKDLLKGANPIIILLLAFIVWWVTNHLPTDIKEVKQEVKEVKQEVKDLRQEVKENRKTIERNHNEIKNLIIEYLGNKAGK